MVISIVSRACAYVCRQGIAILIENTGEDRGRRPAIIGKKTNLHSGTRKGARIIKRAAPRGIHIPAGTEASRNLQDSILPANRCRDVQRARSHHPPGKPEVRHDLLQKAFDVIQWPSVGVTQPRQNPGNRGIRGKQWKRPQELRDALGGVGLEFQVADKNVARRPRKRATSASALRPMHRQIDCDEPIHAAETARNHRPRTDRLRQTAENIQRTAGNRVA